MAQPAFNLSKFKIAGSILPFIIMGAAFLFYNSYTIVETGHVGVVRTLGAVQPNALPEGFHFKKPFVDKVEQIDIRLGKETSKASSASKDLQTVRTEVTVQFSLNGELAPQVFQRIGKRSSVELTVIQPAIQESVKAVTAKYTAEELVTKREEVKSHIHESIKDVIINTLQEKEVGLGLSIANVAITDFDFSEEFNRAIELKVKAEQEALQAKNEKIRRVTQAEAAAVEKRLASEAVAFQITTESRARADAIAREARALKNNPELIQLRLAEKWDGVLPQFSAGDSIPLIDFGDISKKKR